MLQMLINVVFTILNTIANIFLAPLLLIFNFLNITWLSDVLNAISSVFNIFFNYFIFFVDLLCIPRNLLEIVFGVILGIFAFNTSVRTISFITACYRAFKP